MSRRRSSRPDPLPLQSILDDLVARRRWAGRVDGARIFDVWEEVAGPEIAAHSRPVRLAGGVLVIAVDDPAWATQLQFLAPELQARANSHLGPDLVRQVRITTDRP